MKLCLSLKHIVIIEVVVPVVLYMLFGALRDKSQSFTLNWVSRVPY
jgi:hypothetical protein